MGWADNDEDASSSLTAAPGGQCVGTLCCAAFAGGNDGDRTRWDAELYQHVDRTPLGVNASPRKLRFGDRRARHQDDDFRYDTVVKEIAGFELAAVAAFGSQHHEIGWRERVARRHCSTDARQDRPSSGASDQQDDQKPDDAPQAATRET
jgi:hypothetical protein